MRGRNRLSVFNDAVVSSEIALGGRPGQLVFSSSETGGAGVVGPGTEVPYAEYMRIDYVTTNDTLGELSVNHDGTILNGWKLSRAYTTFRTNTVTTFTGTSSVSLDRYVAGVVVNTVTLPDGWYYNVVPSGSVSLTGTFVTNMGGLFRMAAAIDPAISGIAFDVLSSMPSTSTATSITRTIRRSAVATGVDGLAIDCGPTVYTTGIINTFVRAFGGVWTPASLTACPV
jgi:hypothetical protein